MCCLPSSALADAIKFVGRCPTPCQPFEKGWTENFYPPTARTCAGLLHRRGVSRRPKARIKSSLPTFLRKNSIPDGISCQRGPQVRFSHSSSAASAAVRDSKVLCLLSFKKEQRTGQHKLPARAAGSLFAPKFCGVSRSARIKSSLPAFFQERTAYRTA